MCVGNQKCSCNVVSDVRSVKEQELKFSNAHFHPVPDDEQTAKARAELLSCPDDVDRIVALGDALAFQMRYTEALRCYEKARDLRPDDYKIRRKCAGRYLSTFNLDKAESAFEWCVANTSDRLDALYMLACCKYYQGEYQTAKTMFDECIDLAKDNGDMYVAALFWAVACSVQTGQDIAGDMAKFSEDIPIGHHTGYMQSLKLFAGKKLAECDTIPKEDELQLCIFTYGVHLYYMHKQNALLADAFLAGTLNLDTYFAAFAYLGAYSEYIRQKR